jgi:hypothetical protein
MKLELDAKTFDKLFTLLLKVVDREERRSAAREEREAAMHLLELEREKIKIAHDQLKLEEAKLGLSRKKSE